MREWAVSGIAAASQRRVENLYANSHEALAVRLAHNGDRDAFAKRVRRHDTLRLAAGDAEDSATTQNDPALTMDLEQALRLLEPTVRLCIVLSYQEQMSHGDIAELTGLALGTVKSHIRRGAERLRKQLGAYAPLEKRHER